jgi:hypothetical protein
MFQNAVGVVGDTKPAKYVVLAFKVNVLREFVKVNVDA